MGEMPHDTDGKLLPRVVLGAYVQAQHIHTEFYDKPGAYLETRARHMRHSNG